MAIGPALVPYLAIGVIGTLAILQWWRPDLAHPALPGLVLGGAVLMGLLILRLVVAQQEFAGEVAARARRRTRGFARWYSAPRTPSWWCAAPAASSTPARRSGP